MNTAEKQRLMVRYKKLYVQGWDELLTKLKKHGGEMIVPIPEPEEHVRLFLKHGRIFEATKIVRKKGEPSRCHQNASQLWAENESLQLVTGYALSDNDALWRQHSWLFDPTNAKLIETTVPMSKYFGVALNEFQALKFAMENMPAYANPPMCPQRIVNCCAEIMKMVVRDETAQLRQILQGAPLVSLRPGASHKSKTIRK